MFSHPSKPQFWSSKQSNMYWQLALKFVSNKGLFYHWKCHPQKLISFVGISITSVTWETQVLMWCMIVLLFPPILSVGCCCSCLGTVNLPITKCVLMHQRAETTWCICFLVVWTANSVLVCIYSRGREIFNSIIYYLNKSTEQSHFSYVS